jgi:hypothetical protein
MFNRQMDGSPLFYLVSGFFVISLGVHSILTGKTWVRFGGWVYRADEPKTFWWNVAILFLIGRRSFTTFRMTTRGEFKAGEPPPNGRAAMAIWQFGVILIPQSAILAEFGTLPALIPMEMTDHLWWSKQQPAQGFEKQIDLLLSQTKSWSEEIRIWGSESGNDAHVCYTDAEKNVVEEIAFRLDARDISLDLVRMICTLAAQLSCVLLTADCEVLQPVESEMLAAIRNSTATKFIDDPVAALGKTVTFRARRSQDTPSGEGKS